jgi:RNA polymerase sigma-70 factor (ECF subfamily)
MTDELARRIRAGDISAFEEVFRQLHAPLCEVVDSYVQSQAVAEEIVQDLFFAVWMKRAEFTPVTLRGYLFAAARNRALHHERHRSIVRRVARLLPSRPEVSGVAGNSQLIDAKLVEDEARLQLRAAIQRLPERSRLAITLRIDHEMSDRDIAESMGISLKGVEKLMSIARRKLREQLGDGAGIDQ